jgi:uncharacterized protein YqjF (DUF2071 family)
VSHPTFQQTKHRPWPLPNRNWIGCQVWHDLLFVHWEVDKDWLRKQIPPQLSLDLFDDKAWIGIVPFDMKGVRFRGLPAPSWICDFPEVNVRTYVRYEDKPGVWFFSLDVPNPLAVWVARNFYHLPYFKAKMHIRQQGRTYHYHHQRGALRFNSTYKPLGRIEVPNHSFETWSTERYCLYTQKKGSILYRAQIHHPKWPLERAALDIHQNTLLKQIPVGRQHPAILFSKKIDVVIYPLEKLT